MADKTLKEIADELGISKDKVRYRVGKLPRNFTYQKNGITYLRNNGYKKILEELGVEISTPNSAASHTQNLTDSTFSILKKELEEKNTQLANKDEQLVTMQKLLDQQQQLTLQLNKRIEQLEAQLQIGPEAPEEKQPSAEEQADPDPVPDKKWWHFLRRDS
ncbi:DUF536 domain-containing protein [Enterococcus sp. AZ126]|uniref:DUF536 domain-containing protein n=1 Tax=Enterococcus sp. AZ126 TaxID=2774635 RepID=UPI003F687F02